MATVAIIKNLDTLTLVEKKSKLEIGKISTPFFPNGIVTCQ